MTQFVRIAGKLSHYADGETTACGQEIPANAKVSKSQPKAGRCGQCVRVESIRHELKDAWISNRDTNRMALIRELVGLRAKR